MNECALNGDGWSVRAVGDLSRVPDRARGRSFPARVPGCVHLDLIRAGLLEHPNQGFAERDQEWVGRTDWRYELEFEPPPGGPDQHRNLLRFACLDTLARVELNGDDAGTAANGLHPHAFDVSAHLRPGLNTLAVTFAAPVGFIEREHEHRGMLPFNGDHLGWSPFQMMRKSACNFGWDWGPRVATSGIAGLVALEVWAGEPQARAWPSVERVDGDRWMVTARVEWDDAAVADGSLSLTLSRDGQQVITTDHGSAWEGGTATATCLVESPEVWWPRGTGEQPLYDLQLRARAGGEEVTYTWRIGFRTVEIDTSPDDSGARFAVRVNGTPVFCRGANWIPDTLFQAEATPSRVRSRVLQAAEANMNILRVWGGGVYEQAAFYEACDELGVMVWQDFMFACALYPEHPEFLDSVRREARAQVARLASHPSVVLWCGGNECVQAYQHWGWEERLEPGQAWGERIWQGLLPEVVSEMDPARPYWPNSPWSGTEPEDPSAAGERAILDTQDPDRGDRHTWDLQFEDVRRVVPRFVSEFGRVAPACERTLSEALLLTDDIRGALEHRLRQTGGSKVAYDPVLPAHFRHVATDLRGWLWQTQVLQARALTTHIEWLRANSPRCMGALIWQLNDCWACQSWSLIDSGGRPKPAWYAVRRSFEPRLLTIQPMNGDERLSAVLVNDTHQPIEGDCLVRRVAFDGSELACETVTIHAERRSVGRVDALLDLVGEPQSRSSEALVVDCDGARSVWFWERDRELTLPDSPLRASLAERDGRVVVRLEATALSRDVIIAADLLGEHARAADNTFTMLAGEVREVEIEGAESVAGLPIGEVVRCASGAAVAL